MAIHLSEADAAKLGLEPARKRRDRVKTGKAAGTAFQALCVAHGLPEPVPEYLFHGTRGWKFDYAFVAAHVALEVEGSIFGTGKPCPVCKRRRGGGHSSITGILRDLEKYREAAICGWRIIRCQPAEMKSGVVFQLLKRAMP